MSVDAPYLPALPQGWREIQIKFRYWRQLGKMLQNEAKTAEDREIGFLRTLNVHWRGVDFGDLSPMWMHPAEYDMYGIRQGDLVVCEGGEVGRAAIVPELPEPIIAQNHIHRLRPHGDDDPRFLRYVLWHIRASNWFSVLCNKATIQTLPGDTLGAIKVPIPPPQQQRRIADWLDHKCSALDQVIERKKKLVAAMGAEFSAVRDRAILGLDAAGIPNQDVIWRHIPAGWKLMPMKFATRWQEGPGIMATDFRDEGTPLLRIANITPGFVNLAGCCFVDAEMAEKRWGHFKVSAGDLLISCSATTGIVSTVSPDAVGSIPYTGIIRLLPFAHILTRDFLRHFVVSDPYLTQIELLKTGSTIKHYGPVHLSKVKMLVPHLAQQREICKIIDGYESVSNERIKCLNQQIDSLLSYRQSLITAAVTGQVSPP